MKNKRLTYLLDKQDLRAQMMAPFTLQWYIDYVSSMIKSMSVKVSNPGGINYIFAGRFWYVDWPDWPAKNIEEAPGPL